MSEKAEPERRYNKVAEDKKKDEDVAGASFTGRMKKFLQIFKGTTTTQQDKFTCDEETKKSFLLQEKAEMLLRSSKFKEAASKLDELLPMKTSNQLRTKLMIAECKLHLGYKERAFKAIDDIIEAMTTSPRAKPYDVQELADYYVDNSLYIRALILMKCAVKLYKMHELPVTVGGPENFLFGKVVDVLSKMTSDAGGERGEVRMGGLIEEELGGSESQTAGENQDGQSVGKGETHPTTDKTAHKKQDASSENEVDQLGCETGSVDLASGDATQGRDREEEDNGQAVSRSKNLQGHDARTTEYFASQTHEGTSEGLLDARGVDDEEHEASTSGGNDLQSIAAVLGLPILQNLLDELQKIEHPNLDVETRYKAWHLFHMGQAYKATGQYENAFKVNNKAVQITKQHFGEPASEDQILGHFLRNAAQAKELLKEFGEARELYQEAIESYKRSTNYATEEMKQKVIEDVKKEIQEVEKKDARKRGKR